VTVVDEISSSMADIASRFGMATPAAAPTAAAPSTTSATAFADELSRAGTTYAAAAAPSTGSTSAGDRAVTLAERYLGVPYVWGGTDPATGLDCSGLTQLVYRQLGVDLPRVSTDQARVGTEVPNLTQAQPGDLLAFGSPVDHVAIYLGNNRMIEAPHPGAAVRIATVDRTPTTIRRLLPTAAGVSVAAAGAGDVPYAAAFRSAAERTGVPYSVLTAVAAAESDFNPNAVSSAGARGIMQLMPGTARDLGVVPMNPNESIYGGARLLADDLRQFGSLPLALAAYNAGPGAVQHYGGIPPYAETRADVQRILGALSGGAA
jgi:hypothetical protein